MSFSRKVARRLARDERIAANQHQNPVKEIMKRQRAIQLRQWHAQTIVPSLLRLCGHYVPTQISLDKFSEDIYVRGTTITAPGRAPKNWESISERIRLAVQSQLKAEAASGV